MNGIDYFAYLDPNTGSLLIQSVIGAVAGIALFGRRAIASVAYKVRGVFGKNKRSDDIS